MNGVRVEPVASDAFAVGIPGAALVEPHELPASAAMTERAQAVRCGERWFAFPYGWARSAVDEVMLSLVPGAPAWLAGAANVDGRVLPVVDLLAWAEPGRFIDSHARDARLLVGGEGADAVAVLFQGLPRLVHIEHRADAKTGDAAVDRFLLGHDTADGSVAALDAAALVNALVDELALR